MNDPLDLLPCEVWNGILSNSVGSDLRHAGETCALWGSLCKSIDEHRRKMLRKIVLGWRAKMIRDVPRERRIPEDLNPVPNAYKSVHHFRDCLTRTLLPRILIKPMTRDFPFVVRFQRSHPLFAKRKNMLPIASILTCMLVSMNLSMNQAVPNLPRPLRLVRNRQKILKLYAFWKDAARALWWCPTVATDPENIPTEYDAIINKLRSLGIDA